MQLGQRMGLNCLTWMMAIVESVEQQRLAAMASIVSCYNDICNDRGGLPPKRGVVM